MAGIVVSYRTALHESERNQQLVEDVFAELARSDPGGLRYAAFRVGDAASFLHVALIDDLARNPLANLPSFAAFQRNLAARCEVPPAPSHATLVGSYRMFA